MKVIVVASLFIMCILGVIVAVVLDIYAYDDDHKI